MVLCSAYFCLPSSINLVSCDDELIESNRVMFDLCCHCEYDDLLTSLFVVTFVLVFRSNVSMSYLLFACFRLFCRMA